MPHRTGTSFYTFGQVKIELKIEEIEVLFYGAWDEISLMFQHWDGSARRLPCFMSSLESPLSATPADPLATNSYAKSYSAFLFIKYAAEVTIQKIGAKNHDKTVL